MLAVYGDSSLKASKPNVHPKLSTALCGRVQVFFMVSYVQYTQNTFISAKKLLKPTHPI